ncbi:hypothetical protein [Flagellimonas sp. CMM7]|uniref:hypothetical protein n=1 Tax=Flagellimonas sp. CMM7 TaxID=2654676 RepID=UPI0013D41B8D|nr:hypothetical protein [Flagellimonas sp. CMM7]UII79687.1 hypothetical protein LV704_18750 [Flagellimonas sp. CMM7]
MASPFRKHFHQLISTVLLVFVCGKGYCQILDSLAVDCIKTKYNEKNVNIDSLLNIYEDFLIKNEFLSQKKERRYTTYFQKMFSENDFIGYVPEDIFNVISKVEIGKHMDRGCFDNLVKHDIETFSVAGKFFLFDDFLGQVKEIENTPKEMGSFFLRTFQKVKCKDLS